jgi:hypothetical protein
MGISGSHKSKLPQVLNPATNSSAQDRLPRLTSGWSEGSGTDPLRGALEQGLIVPVMF